MNKLEFSVLKRCKAYHGAIGYGPHRKRIQFSLLGTSHIDGMVWVWGHGHKQLYHYRSIQLPRVSADLLKESNNKK